MHKVKANISMPLTVNGGVILLLLNIALDASAVEILDLQWLLSALVEDALPSSAQDKKGRRTTGNMSYNLIPLLS